MYYSYIVTLKTYLKYVCLHLFIEDLRAAFGGNVSCIIHVYARGGVWRGARSCNYAATQPNRSRQT